MPKRAHEGSTKSRRRLGARLSLAVGLLLLAPPAAKLAAQEIAPGPQFSPSAPADPYFEPQNVAATPASQSNFSTNLSAEQIKLIVAEALEQDKKKEEKKDDKKPKEYEVGSDKKMTSVFNSGTDHVSANKDFKFHVGGRSQVDAIFLQGNSGDFTNNMGNAFYADRDAVDIRRARLRADGTMYENIDFVAEYDFVNNVNDNAGLAPGTAPGVQNNEQNVIGTVAPTEVWFQISKLPFGNIRIGNLKEPIGFEHLASSRYLDFLERAYLQDAYYGAFNNGFSPAVMAFGNWGEDERGYWAAAVAKTTDNVFAYNVGDGEYAYDGRLTFLPYYDEPSGGRYMVHLGSSISVRQGDNGRFRSRTRTSLRNGPGGLNPVIADTGWFFADQHVLWGQELVAQYGSLILQAEYTTSWYGNTIASSANNNIAGTADSGVPVGPNLGTYFTQGYYVQALYFLTGEHRIYEKKEARFGRVIPHENFFYVPGPCGNLLGRGAWQVGARYNYLDLRDIGVRNGGVCQDVTLGVNWFLNPNMKIQANYVWTERTSGGATNAANAGGGLTGSQNGFGVRIAHDF